MKTYAAISDHANFSGSALTTLHWAQSVSNYQGSPVKVYLIRVNEKFSRIIAEASKNSIRHIPQGRRVPTRKLLEVLHG